MTSEAKVGLLLGLAFTFIIAFLVNGLPTVRPRTNNNELTSKMTRPHQNRRAIAARERKAIKTIRPAQIKRPQQTRPNRTPATNVRFTTELPKPRPAEARPVLAKPAIKTTLPKPEQQKRPAKVVSTGPALPKFYVVKTGDSLAAIALKLYGPVQGNRRITVQRLFAANSARLRSPDEIHVGQTIAIPALRAPANNNRKTRQTLAAARSAKLKSPRRTGIYTVRDGDSLWKIAANKLGNGRRYTEITKLNADLLLDEDNLAVGMRLKLPAR